MAANVLNSHQAVAMSVYVVRAFVRMLLMATNMEPKRGHLKEPPDGHLMAPLDGHVMEPVRGHLKEPPDGHVMAPL